MLVEVDAPDVYNDGHYPNQEEIDDRPLYLDYDCNLNIQRVYQVDDDIRYQDEDDFMDLYLFLLFNSTDFEESYPSINHCLLRDEKELGNRAEAMNEIENFNHTDLPTIKSKIFLNCLRVLYPWFSVDDSYIRKLLPKAPKEKKV